jgi:hypothetical protein
MPSWPICIRRRYGFGLRVEASAQAYEWNIRTRSTSPPPLNRSSRTEIRFPFSHMPQRAAGLLHSCGRLVWEALK